MPAPPLPTAVLAVVTGIGEGRRCCAHFIVEEVEAETCAGTRARIRTSAFVTKVGNRSENRKAPNSVQM